MPQLPVHPLISELGTALSQPPCPPHYQTWRRDDLPLSLSLSPSLSLCLPLYPLISCFPLLSLSTSYPISSLNVPTLFLALSLPPPLSLSLSLGLSPSLSLLSGVDHWSGNKGLKTEGSSLGFPKLGSRELHSKGKMARTEEVRSNRVDRKKKKKTKLI